MAGGDHGDARNVERELGEVGDGRKREADVVDFEAGFEEARHVSAEALTERYFAGRTDGLRPPINAEELLVARS